MEEQAWMAPDLMTEEQALRGGGEAGRQGGGEKVGTGRRVILDQCRGAGTEESKEREEEGTAEQL